MGILSTKSVKESSPNCVKIDKSFDEISGYDLDAIEEEISLLESIQTKKYKCTVKLIYILLAIVSVRLEPYRENSNTCKNDETSIDYSANGGEELKNFIRFRNPFVVTLKSSTSVKVILRDFVYPIALFLFIIYISIKYTVMAILQSNYDSLVDKFNPKLRENSSRTEICCFEKDIYMTDQDKEGLARLDAARSLLETLGDPIIFVGGPGTSLMSFISTLPFVVYLTSVMYLLFRRRRADIVSFYLNPLNEIFRIKKELAEILFRTAGSINNYRKTANLKLSSNYASSKANHLTSNLNNFTTYTKMLFDTNLVEMVRPANLTSKWHKTLISVEAWIAGIVIVIGVIPSIFLMLIITSYELYKRVQQRLKSFECQKWATGAVLIKETMKLTPLETQKDKLAYLTYDGSAAQLFQLIAKVEIKYYLSIRICISLLEIFLATGLAVAISSFFYYLYVRSFLGRLIWLKQIQEQVIWAKNQLVKLSNNKLNCDNQIKIQLNNNNINNRSYVEINSEKLMINCMTKYDRQGRNVATTVKALLVTYLNYELYRKQQPEYLKLVTFLVFQSISLVFTMALFSYSVGTGTKSNLSTIFLLFMPTYLMIFVNVHLLMGAYLISRNSSLNKNILDMLAAASSNEMHLLDSIDLWRRQLLDNEGTKKNFAVKLFSVYLSYDSIINLDAYLVALWFLLSGRE